MHKYSDYTSPISRCQDQLPCDVEKSMYFIPSQIALPLRSLPCTILIDWNPPPPSRRDKHVFFISIFQSLVHSPSLFLPISPAAWLLLVLPIPRDIFQYYIPPLITMTMHFVS